MCDILIIYMSMSLAKKCVLLRYICQYNMSLIDV